ncbi:MAG TPA: riboflavin synthase [Chromatiales bacterium]|jgi:riboflavin synthase|nr:riboflavin synthase [Chromatiaceae bacterium]HIB84119.1 riboflavin synthase [Chromatiaceae bacterium]HIN82633.1 riboflavin synthase [Chromatiales bacterium]HIO13735.1 riboflavin synthase [Chromatiales bacterium]HIO54156.1 riboflavin synthase [Chromatiales bacterium]
MFTGIIQAMGTLASMKATSGDVRLRVATGELDMRGVALGDSIAVNGVCLTAVEFGAEYFCADVSRETLDVTTLGGLQPGATLNLEKALTLSTPLGGHLVSGHVDGIGEVIARSPDARSERFEIRAADSLARYLAAKGSICVDGVSLTINSVDGAVVGLNIVPHTLQQTNLSELHPGRRVNLEVDIIARYLERLMLGDRAAEATGAGLTEAVLRDSGFI